jgi:UDP-arabinose 4-epimerase
MRVLVTGGAGYIGSHTAKSLALAGFEPIVFDNLSEGHEWAVRWGPLVRGDLADKASLASTLEAYKITAVIHFAANAYVGESVQNPRKYFRNNVANTLNLLDAMLDTGVTRMVFSSTCATYGKPLRTPMSEDHPQSPINPYGESKLFVEKVLRWYEPAYQFNWMSLRYFNAAGADPDGEIGEDHDPETHLIPLAIQAALGARPYVEVFGSDYDTPDGSAIRDYVHVTDLARAHVMALQYLIDGGHSLALNLGSGIGSSVRDVLSTVERVSGRTLDIRYVPRRAGDPEVLLADTSLAKQTLGWTALLSKPETIVDTAWRWSRSLRAQAITP